MDNFITEPQIYIILKIIIIISALNWGLIAINKEYNIFKMFSSIFSNDETVEKGIYIFIFLITIYIIFQRKTFIPYSDIAIVPIIRLLPESKQNNFELEIVIKTGEGQKVIYWTSNKNIDLMREGGNKNEINEWQKEYGDFENHGISKIEKDGTAKLYIKCPRKYYIKYGKIIPKTVHYRIVKDRIAGEVKTIYLEQ